nr:MAG: hypothetical protein [Bacteriophage sp.]
MTGCHQFSPPRDTSKDARRRCFAALFRHFDGFSACFGGIFPGFLAILTAEKVRFFGLFSFFYHFPGHRQGTGEEDSSTHGSESPKIF